jgi:hypothetical protein
MKSAIIRTDFSEKTMTHIDTDSQNEQQEHPLDTEVKNALEWLVTRELQNATRDQVINRFVEDTGGSTMTNFDSIGIHILAKNVYEIAEDSIAHLEGMLGDETIEQSEISRWHNRATKAIEVLNTRNFHEKDADIEDELSRLNDKLFETTSWLEQKKRTQ